MSAAAAMSPIGRFLAGALVLSCGFAPRFAQGDGANLTRAEIEGVHRGVERLYHAVGLDAYDGLEAVVRIELDRDGRIVGRPELLHAKAGTDAAQRALFQAGRRALIRAAGAGVFKGLPQDKYDRWKRITFKFTTEGLGRSQ